MAAPQLTVRNTSGPTPATSPAPLPAPPPPPSAAGPADAKQLPSIRFIPHQDPRAGRPSLQFPAITRTLPDETALIRVGRYSERDNLPDMSPHAPSAAAVGFKSKVVSRKHCELWCKDGSWYIRDVKSSSGTFLNHIRLSQPNVESKPFRIKDGDIIQLGIDFRGGEEMIFRCVKIRVECNRGWQQGLNNFKYVSPLPPMTSSPPSPHSPSLQQANPPAPAQPRQGQERGRCRLHAHLRVRHLSHVHRRASFPPCPRLLLSWLLTTPQPCQSLFVAPCSHVWHYKCIRPILNGPTWPNFLCPNCRAVADLEEDVEEPDTDDWEANGEPMSKVDTEQGTHPISPPTSASPLSLNGSPPHNHGHGDHHDHDNDDDDDNNNNSSSSSSNNDHDSPVASNLTNLMANVSMADSLDEIANQPLPETPDRRPTPPPTSSVNQSVAIHLASTNQHPGLSPLHPTLQNSLIPDRAPDGPMTPRNDVGPFVLDGSAGRSADNRDDEDNDDDDDNDSSSSSSNNNNITNHNNNILSDPSSDSSSSRAPSPPHARFT